jgi:uncharacterized membrane protein YoaK (UPF0700 family)
MRSYGPNSVALAIGLSALAGYVDAIGFMHLGGFFVSFMSGNSTRLGVALAGMKWMNAAIAIGLIGSFVGGVVLAEFLARLVGDRWRRAAVLLMQAGLLVAAAVLHFEGWVRPGITLMAVAMGSENTVFRRNGEVTVGLTYMTGTLVKMGQNICVALTGGPLFGWVSYFALWFGMLCGAITGAFVFSLVGLNGLWFAGLAAVVFSAFAAFVDPVPADKESERANAPRKAGS